VPQVLAKAYIFAMQGGMKKGGEAAPQRFGKAGGDTEKQAVEVCTTERKTLGEGNELNVVMKEYKVSIGEVEALLAGKGIVTGVGKEAAERVLVRGAARCTPHQIFEAKKQLH
jgi:hypothetical protein